MGQPVSAGDANEENTRTHATRVHTPVENTGRLHEDLLDALGVEVGHPEAQPVLGRVTVEPQVRRAVRRSDLLQVPQLDEIGTFHLQRHQNRQPSKPPSPSPSSSSTRHTPPPT